MFLQTLHWCIFARCPSNAAAGGWGAILCNTPVTCAAAPTGDLQVRETKASLPNGSTQIWCLFFTIYMEGEGAAKSHSPAGDLHAGPPATQPHGVQLRGLQLVRTMPCAPIRTRAAAAAFPSIWLLCAQRIKLREKKSRKRSRERRNLRKKVGKQPLLKHSLLFRPSAECHSEAWVRRLSCLGYSNLQENIQISGILEPNQPGANPRSTTYRLCALGKIISPLKAPIPYLYNSFNIC